MKLNIRGRFEWRCATGLLAWTVISISPTLASGQRWELGAGATGNFYTARTVTASNVKAIASFDKGIGFTAWLGHNLRGTIGGELRYAFQNAPITLREGANEYSFGSRVQSLHYDILLHAGTQESRVRPFIALGGGVRSYEGVGRELLVQSFNNLIFLTKTTEWVPLLTVGAGLKMRLTDRILFRAEVRDYASQIPKKVMVPSPAATLNGWFHNFVAQVGLSVLF